VGGTLSSLPARRRGHRLRNRDRVCTAYSEYLCKFRHDHPRPNLDTDLDICQCRAHEHRQRHRRGRLLKFPGSKPLPDDYLFNIIFIIMTVILNEVKNLVSTHIQQLVFGQQPAKILCLHSQSIRCSFQKIIVLVGERSLRKDRENVTEARKA
jgi:hypothetical protein